MNPMNLSRIGLLCLVFVVSACAMQAKSPTRISATRTGALRRISKLEAEITENRRRLGLPEERLLTQAAARTFQPPRPVYSMPQRQDKCKIVQAICTASKKICHLADELEEEQSSKKCAQAKRDCIEARKTVGCPVSRPLQPSQ